MQIQFLNSFRGDDIKDVDTSTPEGRKSAGQLIADLLRTGSALFLEKDVNGTTYTYRVTGYDEERDKIKLSLSPNEATPADFEVLPTKRKSGPRKGMKYNTFNRRAAAAALVGSSAGQIVSVAPVSGGTGAIDEATEAPEIPSWEAIRSAVATLSEQRGWHHGCPMPSSTNQNHRLMVAPGSPLYDKSRDGMVDFNQNPTVFICKNSEIDETPDLDVNRWTPQPFMVDVYRRRGRAKALRIPTDSLRLRFLLDTLMVRAGSVDAHTEIIAMVSLQQKLSKSQFDSYLLNGAFPETSTRSGVTYILRKGFPTLAIRETPLADGTGCKQRFLAALCLHPMGYYENTWAGCTPPTDEVIAHLMLIRADEHRFWKKSGQHGLLDVRSGI